MSRSHKVRLTGALLLAVVSISVFWFEPFSSIWAHKTDVVSPVNTTSFLPYNEFANGPYTVQGNAILGADGKRYLFHGIGRDGLEYDCKGDGFFDAQHLAYMGPGTNTSNGTYWYANTVRLPLSEGYWLNGQPARQCTAAQYQGLVKTTVDTLTSMHLNVIIDLQWTDAGGQAAGGGAAWQMPDNDSVTFWEQVATIYASYSNVLFELFNEPHPGPWSCWAAPCTITNDTSWVSDCVCTQTFTYQSVGMQALVDAVRGTGATNLALVGGMDWGYDLSQIASYAITGSNVVYDTHPYPYNGKQPPNWDASFGKISDTYPVISAENGEYDCGSSYMSQLLSYFDAHMIGWIGWSWVSVGSPCKYPQLITDYSGMPAADMGILIYQYLRGYASVPAPVPTPSPSPSPGPTPPPTPATGPVSKLWYFAEGRAGAGFKEFLTLGNPTNTNCQVTIQYLTQPDSGAGITKTVSVSVPAARRVTEWVDGDLGTSPSGPGISDAAIVSVDSSATPNCSGIVAERPMYFTFKTPSVNSGSDVVGITHTGTTFYFADLAAGSQPGGGSYASFLPILNPGASSATVTATYYANGQQVGMQQLTVLPNSRGTIVPASARPTLPAHVAVTITSTQPVVVERPTYFSNLRAGNAGVVSGATDVVGVQNLANDWLFAEGYTGGQFQENFVIANLDPTQTQANVTINLEYTDGTRRSYNVTLSPQSQLTWNVNTNAIYPTSQSVSAEITSTGAKIVVEREMFFKYNHVGNGRTLTATGGTDVIGQVGPATATSYSFAEGYTNLGYDEWLTMQNPSANPETITITMANAKGTVYTFSVTIVSHSRYTLDIVGTVMHNLYHNGDSFQGYEVSMAVQSSTGPFVVERPMYWNASGTQGGSDVIGYSGG
jgi:endoglucanase